jgi:hypothetical protein
MKFYRNVNQHSYFNLQKESHKSDLKRMSYAASNMDSDHVCDSSKPNKCAGLKPHWTQLSGIKQRSKLHHFELKISTHIVENVISQTKKE